MATTYAMPTVHSHSGGGHGHSHSRKSATQRFPLQPTSMNGGYQINGGPKFSDLLSPPMQSHHQAHKSIDVYHEAHQEPTPAPSTLELPAPHPSFSTPTNARSKSMERRKSVGLPTHLRLQGKGYGFPSSSNQRFRTTDAEGGAK